MQSGKYLIAETTDMKTRTKSYKIFERITGKGIEPLITGLPTREIAEIKIAELEAQENKR